MTMLSFIKAPHGPGRAFAYAVLTTVGLFWLMHVAITGVGGEFEKSQPLPTIDFVRLKKDAELETRERRKPPKPEPPKQPPPPKMSVDTPPPDQQPLPFAMPKLSLPTTISGGPFLGSYVGGDMSGYSDLIPLMRINPQYPRNAARDRIEGWVEFRITINPDGTVKTATPIKSQPRGVFESAAMQAILKWKFRPKIVDGKGVETTGTQRIEFKMETE
jgi:periplasmic protein TonB